LSASKQIRVGFSVVVLRRGKFTTHLAIQGQLVRHHLKLVQRLSILIVGALRESVAAGSLILSLERVSHLGKCSRGGAVVEV